MRPLVVAVLCAVIAAGCSVPDPQDPTPTPTATPTATTPTPTSPPTPPTPPVGGLAFDGDNAMLLLRAQVLYENGSVRYRVPGTPGNTEVAHLISDNMRQLGYAVTWHHFNATYGCEQLAMHNVIAERPGSSGDVVVFAAHYDTRPIAEKDPDPEKRNQPIMGANDGASGVALLIELARVLPPTDDTVRFVFFDGEDGGGYKGRDADGSRCTEYILGSRAYAASLSEDELAAIDAFVLVDMVGDPRLELPWEMYSRGGPGRVVQDDIYGVAHGLGHMQFKNETGYSIVDDHVPFVQAGVPAVDLIHLTKDGRTFVDTHHTHEDDLENVDAASLAAVGRTLEEWFRERDRA